MTGNLSGKLLLFPGRIAVVESKSAQNDDWTCQRNCSGSIVERQHGWRFDIASGWSGAVAGSPSVTFKPARHRCRGRVSISKRAISAPQRTEILPVLHPLLDNPNHRSNNLGVPFEARRSAWFHRVKGPL
jgi:hypothetical protein